MKQGEILKQARRSKFLTLKKVAKALDCCIGSVSGWENNKKEPRPKMLRKICKLYGITKKTFHHFNYLIPIIGVANASGTFEDTDKEPFFYDIEEVDLENCKLAVIQGDSMEPYNEGDLLILNPKLKIESGDKAYIKLKGKKEKLFKLVYYVSEMNKNDKNLSEKAKEILATYQLKNTDHLVMLLSTKEDHRPLTVGKSEIEYMYRVVGRWFRVVFEKTAKKGKKHGKKNR